jgi:hypothetical protein
MSGSLVAPIDPTKPAGPNAQTADVRANFSAIQTDLLDHETRLETLESGGSLTGPLAVGGDITLPTDCAPASVFTDTFTATTNGLYFNAYVSATGDDIYLNAGPAGLLTMNGPGELLYWSAPSGTPGASVGDVEMVVFKIGPTGDITANGVMTAGADPVNGLDLVTLQYANSNFISPATPPSSLSLAGAAGGDLLYSDTVAPVRARLHFESNGYIWFEQYDETGTSLRQPLQITDTGDVYVYATLTLGTDPVNPLDAATKQYVDASAVTLSARIAALEAKS